MDSENELKSERQYKSGTDMEARFLSHRPRTEVGIGTGYAKRGLATTGVRQIWHVGEHMQFDRVRIQD